MQLLTLDAKDNEIPLRSKSIIRNQNRFTTTLGKCFPMTILAQSAAFMNVNNQLENTKRLTKKQ